MDRVSVFDRTRTELLANRRRMRREGVALMAGEPTSRVVLPIESRREITVRPAFRGERKPYPIDEFLAGFFDRRVWPWTLAGSVLLLAIVAFNHLHH